MASEPLYVNATITIAGWELVEQFIRASGPSGQNVNKVATAVQLHFDVRSSPSLPDRVKADPVKLAGRRLSKDGVLIIKADRFRTRERSRQDARDRLKALVVKAAAPPPPKRRKTRPYQGVGRTPAEGQVQPFVAEEERRFRRFRLGLAPVAHFDKQVASLLRNIRPHQAFPRGHHRIRRFDSRDRQCLAQMRSRYRDLVRVFARHPAEKATADPTASTPGIFRGLNSVVQHSKQPMVVMWIVLGCLAPRLMSEARPCVAALERPSPISKAPF